jgi:hypothetical protein
MDETEYAYPGGEKSGVVSSSNEPFLYGEAYARSAFAKSKDGNECIES